MSYTAPPLFIASAVLTSPQMNVLVNDIIDLDRRTSPVGAVVATSQTTTSTTYTDLATVGPSVNVTIGASGMAWVSIHGAISNASSPLASYFGFGITGASTVAANDQTAIGFTSTYANGGIRTGTTILLTGLTAGSTTFTAKYRMDPGTGPATFVDRRIAVTPLGA